MFSCTISSALSMRSSCAFKSLARVEKSERVLCILSGVIPSMFATIFSIAPIDITFSLYTPARWIIRTYKATPGN